MYRIEVAPGEETVFRTIEELAVGIRNGVITQRSRIYHNASQKWLPIGLHPHYKKALEMPAASAAHPAPPSSAPTVPRKPHPADPRAAGEPRTSGEHCAPAAANPSAPTVSAVVAMQQEVLRDLPVVVIPEPLPWSTPRAAAPAAQPAPVARLAPEPLPVGSPPSRTRYTEPPRTHSTASHTHAPETYAPRAVTEPAARPEPEPTEAATIPARPTARRRRRSGGRPLLLLGFAAALVVGAHFALTPASPAAADDFDVAEPSDVAAESTPGDVVPEASAPEPAPAEVPPQVTSSSARVPMAPGPAFAGSVPAPARSEVAAPPPSPPTREPTPGPAEAAGLAPAPVELDLALPDLAGDSIAPVRTGDTMAMKRILRALNGGKPQETPATP